MNSAPLLGQLGTRTLSELRNVSMRLPTFWTGPLAAKYYKEASSMGEFKNKNSPVVQFIHVNTFNPTGKNIVIYFIYVLYLSSTDLD